MDNFLDAKVVLALVAVAGGVGLVLILRNVEKALHFLLIICIPLQAYLPLIKRGGRPTIYLTISDIAFFIVLFLWILERRKEETWNLGRDKLPQLFYVLAIIPSVIFTNDLSWSLLVLFTIIKLYFFYCYIFMIIKSKEKLFFLLRCILILNISIGVGIFVNKYVLPIEDYYGFEMFGRRNAIGALLTQVTLISMGFLFSGPKNIGRGRTYILLVFTTLALIVNQSRGAIITFGLGVLLFFLVGKKYKFIKMRQIAAIVVLMISCGLIALPYLQERFEAGFKDDSAQSRITLMKVALMMIKENPVVGVGLGNYPDEMKKYIPDWLDIPWIAPVHNQYLQVWAEAGTLGFFGFLSMLMSTIRNGVRAIKFQSSLLPLSVGFLACLISFMVHMLFDGLGETWIIWGSMAIISGLFRQSRSERIETDGKT